MEKLYDSLYNSPLSHHLNIPIRQFEASREFPAFYYYTESIGILLSNIGIIHSQLVRIMSKIPGIAINHFTLSCLIDEIKATNDIEGVRSTRKEIKIAIDQQNNIESQDTVRLWGIVNKYLKLKIRTISTFHPVGNYVNFMMILHLKKFVVIPRRMYQTESFSGKIMLMYFLIKEK